MLANAAPVAVPGPALDVVGTGGDRAHTVNISTMSALVAAGAGARVVKHGNRAASSACGAADLLEALGVAIDLPGPGVARCVDEAGIGFCFAPVFHPGMRHAAVPRRELGVPTAFNFLGPLTNPARPRSAAVGCADVRMAPVMAAVLAARGDTALVFRGDDGLDELTTTTTSRVWAVRDGEVHAAALDPAALGPAGGRPGRAARRGRRVQRRGGEGAAGRRAGAGAGRGAAERGRGAGRVRRAAHPARGRDRGRDAAGGGGGGQRRGRRRAGPLGGGQPGRPNSRLTRPVA